MPRGFRSNKTYQNFRGCNKKVYHSEEETEERRRLCIEANPTLKLKSYKCVMCAGWHLTSKQVEDECIG